MNILQQGMPLESNGSKEKTTYSFVLVKDPSTVFPFPYNLYGRDAENVFGGSPFLCRGKEILEQRDVSRAGSGARDSARDTTSFNSGGGAW